MKAEKDHIIYTAEYIRKYLDGLLSETEMQALEKAALDDPFLADAIEGFEESRNHPVSFESGLADLQKRLAERIYKKEREKTLILFYSNWKIAASVLLILGSAAITLVYINKKTRRNEFAKSVIQDSGASKPGNIHGNKESNKQDQTALQSLPQNTHFDTAATAFNTPAGVGRKSNRNKKIPLASSEIQDTFKGRLIESPVVDLPKASSDSITFSMVTISDSKKNKDSLASAVMFDKQLSGKVSGLEISKNKNIYGNYIKGIVTDPGGKPIPFATIYIKGSKTTAGTDKSGFFKIYVQNSNLESPVLISSVGYEPVSAKFKPDSSYTNLIKLQPASLALNDVVVQGYSAEKEEDNSPAITQSRQKKNEEPPIGWEAFNKYINDNKKILTSDSLLKGEEVISFFVNKKSELSSFKIEKSISPSHDAEVIRLIKAGPPLKISTGGKQKLQVSVSFN